MKKWFVPLIICAIFIFLTALFLTPSVTYPCTEDLLVCVENSHQKAFWARQWHNLLCVYSNVVCVFGRVFL